MFPKKVFFFFKQIFKKQKYEQTGNVYKDPFFLNLNAQAELKKTFSLWSQINPIFKMYLNIKDTVNAIWNRYNMSKLGKFLSLNDKIF